MTASEPAGTLVAMLHAIDRLDWATVHAAFADPVTIDYSDLTGAPAATISVDDLMTGWRALLPGFDATQHLAGPVLTRTEGKTVVVDTHVRGYHYINGAEGGLWTVAGHYIAQLTESPGRWSIAALTLRVFYQEGNLMLADLARTRAAVSPRSG